MDQPIDDRVRTNAFSIKATCDSCDDLFKTHFKPPGTDNGAAWSKEKKRKKTLRVSRPKCNRSLDRSANMPEPAESSTCITVTQAANQGQRKTLAPVR